MITQHKTTILLLIFIACGISENTGNVFAQWPQWGGPDRDFSVEVEGLAETWPEGGPKRLWERALGDGFSTIVGDDRTLYTQFRKGDDEFVIAMNAKTGKTIWEQKNFTPLTDQQTTYCAGPYSTPLIDGDRLFTIGSNSLLLCLDKTNGNVIWSHDLVTEFDAMPQVQGMASSPIVHKGTIILPIGRKPFDPEEAQKKRTDESTLPLQDQSLLAFDMQSGSLVWENRTYGPTTRSTCSSLMLIQFTEQDQLVLFMAKELAGLDPENGKRLWGVTHLTLGDTNASMPVWDGTDTLFCSSAYGVGSRGVKLTTVDGKTLATQLWHAKKMRVHHGNVVLMGDHVYGSSGDFGPAFFSAINIRTGKITWRKRGFNKATCLRASAKVIILDEEGMLALTTLSPTDLKIHAQYNLKLQGAWAAPTLIGTDLFIRDRKRIIALDLSAQSNE